MLKWEKWVCCGIEFLRLKELCIKGCPKLIGDMPKCLPESTYIKISGCGQPMCDLPMAPSVGVLKLEECDDVVVRSAGGLTSLSTLELRGLCKIPGELGQLHSLVLLFVYDCRELEEIPPILHNLTSLKQLVIQECERLVSLSDQMALPPMLEDLEIRYRPVLESLPGELKQNNTRIIQDLQVSDSECGSSRSSPCRLKHLTICACEKLELPLVDEDMTAHNPYHYAASPTNLFITDTCHSLVSFPLAFFTKLKDLAIMNCRNLECLNIYPDGLPLTSLRILTIRSCPNLVYFPQGGLPTPNLTHLQITGCYKLKSLPQGMHSLLTSL